MEGRTDAIAVAAVGVAGVVLDICNANALRAEHTTNSETNDFIVVFRVKEGFEAGGKLNYAPLNQ